MGHQETELKRGLTLPLIIFYGIGTILGSGIYVLVGKVAEEAGIHAPISFMVAAVIAVFSGLSYAELSSRFPEAAGPVTYMQKAFSFKWLSAFVGLAIVLSSILSTATVFNGFTGYLGEFILLPKILTITILTLLLAGFAIWGIVQSAWLILMITLIELGGILFFIFVSADLVVDQPQVVKEVFSLPPIGQWNAILGGAFIAFFAFIGFEDLVSEAEETINPRRNIPIAIIVSLIILTILYFTVSLITIVALPVDELSSSTAPLADVLKNRNTTYAYVISMIGLITSLNGAMVQFILGSRILYGMGKKGMIPTYFAHVQGKTQTPVLATLMVAISTLVVAINFEIKDLAEYTDFVLITVFILVNLSLWMVKRKDAHGRKEVNYPIWVPFIGFFLSLAFLLAYLIG
ncbi:MAG: APC family permease [Cyclobacteriaceae bacterium]